MKLIETTVNNHLTKLARKSFVVRDGLHVQVVSVTDPGRVRGYLLLAVIDRRARCVQLGDSVATARAKLADAHELLEQMGFGD